jgi:crotonobetainyl-CoA:carnitine CoA-transferase CaiB-like acyl-CoA transferase
MTGALAGVRVVDAGTHLAAPYAASILASLGAEVIKVERPGGDAMRALPPFADGVSAPFASANQDKRYVALDLRQEESRELLRELVRRSDVLVHNARESMAAAFGLDADACHDVNANLVHGAIAGFYPSDSGRPGYDVLFQSESGLLDLTGEPDRPPSRIGASAIDHVSGVWLALGVLAALREGRERATVRVSMLDVAVSLLGDRVSAFLASGEVPARMGGGTAVTTPHGVFPTADANIVVGAATDDAFRRLAGVLGPPLDGDERFATQQGRLDNRAEVEGLVRAALAKQGADHWVEVLSRADVPVARVYTLGEAVDRHRMLSATGLRPVRDRAGLAVVAPPVSFGNDGWPPVSGPAEPGRDTDAVLTELGR